MKTSQIMLGDLVMYYGSVSRIDGLWQDIAHIEGEPEEQYVYMQEIEPLTLTAEILEANGFDEAYSSDIHKCYFRQKDNEDGTELYDIEVNIYSDNQNGCRLEVKHFGMGTVQIQFYHVHELQHALRLCGLNDIADNLKMK